MVLQELTFGQELPLHHCDFPMIYHLLLNIIIEEADARNLSVFGYVLWKLLNSEKLIVLLFEICDSS